MLNVYIERRITLCKQNYRKSKSADCNYIFSNYSKNSSQSLKFYVYIINSVLTIGTRYDQRKERYFCMGFNVLLREKYISLSFDKGPHSPFIFVVIKLWHVLKVKSVKYKKGNWPKWSTVTTKCKKIPYVSSKLRNSIFAHFQYDF